MEKMFKRNSPLAFFDSLRNCWQPEGGGGAIALHPIGISTKMQNEKNTTFLALLRPFYALEWTK